MRFVLLLSICLANVARARPVLEPDGMARLGRYDVLTFSDPAEAGLNRGKAIGVFDASPEEIYRVATEYAHYAEFLPRVVMSRVLDRPSEDRAVVKLGTDVRWPVARVWVDLQFEHDRVASDIYRIRFWRIRGSLKRYQGSLYIEPWSKEKSAVTYELVLEPGSLVPRRIINKHVQHVVAKFVHALRQRTNALHHDGRLHPLDPPSPGLALPLGGPKAPIPAAALARAR